MTDVPYAPNGNLRNQATIQPEEARPYPLPLLIAIGAIGLTIVLLSWIPDMRSSILSAQPKAYWYLSRTSAVVAYALLWASMAFGITITNKMARVWPGGPTAYDVHEYTSLLGLGFALFHALVLVADPYIHYTLDQVLIPFDSTNYRQIWVGLGQVGLYLLALVTFSFYVRKLIGHKAWRWLHYVSFPVFALAAVHAITSGSDSTNPLIGAMYWVTLGGLVLLTGHRLVFSRSLAPARK